MIGVALSHPRSVRSDFEFGFLFPIYRVGHALPLLGLGLAAAQAPVGVFVAAMLAFVLGMPLGAWSETLFLANVSGAGMIDSLFLMPPLSCILAGVLLVVPAALPSLAIMPAALILGAVLGLNLSLSDPTTSGDSFAAGASLAGLWLVAAPALLGLLFAARGFAIATRIFCSWLIAIGLMLGALQLIPLSH